MISEVTEEPHTHASEEHREEPLARSIEQQTVQLRSNTWLWVALGLDCRFVVFPDQGRRAQGEFRRPPGANVPAAGLYNELVKLLASEGA